LTLAGLIAAASPQDAPAQPAGREVSCHESASFFVIARTRGEDVGTDFVVKTKPAAGASPPCAFKAGANDYRIGGPDDSYYFTALKGHFLILDAGTGPGREISIFDLTERRQVFRADTFSDEPPVASETGLQFWMQVAEGNPQNCPRFKEFEAMSMGAAVETKARYDFASGKVTRSNETRCVATQ
jgi:hypothetical protein